MLYVLEKRDVIRSIDSAVYTLGDGQLRPRLKKKFIPAFSPELSVLSVSIKAAFPYAEYLIWETRILHEFMLHQPGQNQIILETEKEAAESVFNFMNDRYGGKVFLQPDRVTFERYILHRADSIIVSTLVTQSPHQKVDDVPCPKLEKILVDVIADDEKFYVFQGQELVHIYETAFYLYRVSEKALFRYAERRKMVKKIRAFINQETNIQLIQHGGMAQ